MTVPIFFNNYLCTLSEKSTDVIDIRSVLIIATQKAHDINHRLFVILFSNLSRFSLPNHLEDMEQKRNLLTLQGC